MNISVIIYRNGFFLLYSALCLLYTSSSFAQSKTDSLLSLLKTGKEDTNKINIMVSLAYQIYSVKPDSTILLCNEALALAEKINYKRKRTIGIAYQNLGIGYHVKGDYDKALENYNKALLFFEKDADINNLANISNNLGVLYYNKGIYDKALPFFFKALKFNEDLGKKDGIARGYNTIGAIYDARGEIDTALKYYNKSLQLAEESGIQKDVATASGNIGVIYRKKGNYSESEKFYLKSLRIHEEQNDKRNIGIACNNLGALYMYIENSSSAKKENYNKSKDYLFRGLKIFEEIGDKTGIAGSYTSIGQLYMYHLNSSVIADAKKYLNKSLEISREIGAIENLRNTYQILSSLDSASGNLKSSLANYKMYVLYKDSLINEESIKKLTQAEEQNKFDKKETIAKAEQEKKDAVAAEEKNKEKVIRYSVIGGLAVVLVFLAFVYRSLQITRKQKHIIELQKNEVSQQKELVEEHQKEIIDSITYAKRLQYAILPPNEFIKKQLPKSFVLYKPKDIVAGDFYWMECIDNTVFIAAADCTGHGVPGAMVSIVCSNALNRTVKEFGLRDTGKILDKVTDLVLETFEKSGEQIKDGMDISLLSYNKTSRQIQWSGANNPLWYIQNGQVVEIKADKQPVGKFDVRKPFTTNAIEYSENTTFYLFTDGLPDQFGGHKGKKFMYRRFKENLTSISNLTMDEQQSILEKAFQEWKGALEQVDDVTVIGIRV